MLPQIYPNDSGPTGRPRIRSFQGRRGRISPTRSYAFENYVPNYQIALPDQPIDLREVFKSNEIYIDFGCGMGGHTKDLLEQSKCVLAIDVHTAGICDLSVYAHERNLSTFRLFHGDGLDLFEKLKPQTISQIDVYFPDPWPKARHAKRRLFNHAFLAKADELLVSGGKIVLVTDDETYAQHVTEVIASQDLFTQLEFSQPVTMTSFHARGLRLGHQIHKFELEKINTVKNL